MNTLEAALKRVGFDEFAALPTRGEKAHWLLLNGLRTVNPVPMVRLHLGVEWTGGGLCVLREEFVRKGREA